MMVVFEVLVNPTSGGQWPLEGILYQRVLIHIYCDCAIMKAWLPFMMCRKNVLTVRLKFFCWPTITKQIQDHFHADRPLSLTTSVQQGVSLQTKSYTVIKVYVTLKHFCHLKLAMHSKHSKSSSPTIKFSLKNKMDLGMPCHTPPLKTGKKQCHYPSLVPSISPNPAFYY